MDIDLTQSQQQLREVVARRFGRHGDLLSTAPNARWSEYAKAGLLALNVESSASELHAGAVETMIFMEHAGRAGVDDAFVPTVVHTVQVLNSYRQQPLAGDLIEDIVKGATRLSVVTGYNDPGPGSFVVRPAGSEWVIHGSCDQIMSAAESDRFLVPARIVDGSGMVLALIDRTSAGLRVQRKLSWNGQWLGEVLLNNVTVKAANCFAARADLTTLLRRAWDHVTAARCAQTVGVMASLVDFVINSARNDQRYQRLASTSQAMRVEVAEMKMALELARSSSMAAACACRHRLEADREIAVSRAKVQINRTGTTMVRLASQLLGNSVQNNDRASAIFSTLIVAEQLHGDDSFHLGRLVAHAEATL
ncbi:MAG: acyl-CoA dehydrogenase family protein [Acidovorax sp.]|uniref:acyl-CoA dehydrogenase family protein n=1 Tax=Acidovorax sp. TaxID=1872122 RepID=UPI00391DBDDD